MGLLTVSATSLICCCISVFVYLYLLYLATLLSARSKISADQVFQTVGLLSAAATSLIYRLCHVMRDRTAAHSRFALYFTTARKYTTAMQFRVRVVL